MAREAQFVSGQPARGWGRVAKSLPAEAGPGGRGARAPNSPEELILVLVFKRHVILWGLPRVNFGHVGIRRIFHSADHIGLKGLPFFKKFFNAL
jgi:hypothetical protein